MLKKKVSIIASVLVIICICVFLYLFKAHENEQAKLNLPKPGPRVVPFATAEQATWHKIVHAIGTVESKQGVTLSAEVPGRITKVYQQSGVLVKKGTPLFQIYPDTLIAQKKAAEADLALAKYNVVRMKRLFEQKAISQEQYETNLATYRRDEAKLHQIESQLKLTTVRAPFDGLLGLREVEVGDYINIGEKLAAFDSKKDLRIHFAIPGTYATQIKQGQDVILTQHDGKQIKGKVYAINSTINQNNRQLSAWAHVSNPKLYPGEYVDVILNLGKPFKIITIPQTALVQSTIGNYVFVVSNGIAKKVPVSINSRRGTIIGINKGLEAGQIVIAGGQINLRDGSKVTNKTPLIPEEKG